MGEFDGDTLIQEMMSASTTEERFAAVVSGVNPLGLDIVNYGFFDPNAAERVDADILFLTTMSDDWMHYYYDRNLAAVDTHVIRAKAGNMLPYMWVASTIAMVSKPERQVAAEAAETGLRSAMCIPLASPLDPFTPVGGINFASSLNETDFRMVVGRHGAALTSIAQILHNASIRKLWCERSVRRSLSVRERDCLQYVADGKRHDVIAHALGVAKVTVEAHLRNAREKLAAHTLSEAVAKALLFGEITRD